MYSPLLFNKKATSPVVLFGIIVEIAIFPPIKMVDGGWLEFMTGRKIVSIYLLLLNLQTWKAVHLLRRLSR